MIRSLSAGALALAMFGCQPDVGRTEPQPVVFAVFDPTTSQIPLPNDLAFLNPPNSLCPPPANENPRAEDPPACAQAELIAGFKKQFPSDQELPVTIDFTQVSFENGQEVESAPDLDLASFTSSVLYVFSTVGTPGLVPLEPLTEDDYVKGETHGTLTIHHKDHEPWPTGAFTLVLRGGPNGAKTKDGLAVNSSQVFHLITQGKDMTDPQNIGLLRAQLGSTEAAIEQGQQLNLLIALYKVGVFPVADANFPHEELAIATTFAIGAKFTNVEIDPARGKAPLPFDLLRDPETGHLSQLAACTLAGSSVAADGKSCRDAAANAAAGGFLTLDGFSTTGAILAPTSDLVKLPTVTSTSLMLFDLSDPKKPVKVSTPLIIEPCEFASPGACTTPATAVSPVIAIQPAGATAGGPVPFSLPLKDNTKYAVVMTTDIKDKADQPIAPGTVARVLQFKNPVFVGGHSALTGIDDATANSLETMRLELQPVFATLATGGVPASKVATAYTFKTQSFLKTGVQLAALPYTQPAATGASGAVNSLGAAAAFSKYGVPSAIPSSHIAEVLETSISTFNLLDPASGAFNPDPSKAALETIKVLIATPFSTNTNIPPCPGAPLTTYSSKCSPMVIFRHGLTRGRADMLLIADAITAAGMTAVAIDAAKHGDRSLCSSGAGALSGCVATCTPIPGAEHQGDTAATGGTPGTCDAQGLVKNPVAGGTGNTDGIAKVSGNYLVSANFFRTRDSLRQDIIDESQLVRAIAFVPSGVKPTGHTVFDHMTDAGVIIDPSTIYYAGQSLGAIQGAANVATNPRISKAVFNVGGGTIVDIFLNSAAFKPAVDAILAGLGIDRATDPAGFLQFVTVAKTILDPADPINYAGHLTDINTTLPNLLPPLNGNPNGTVPQLPKRILTQVANCDLDSATPPKTVVPNVFSLVYAVNAFRSPLPPAAFAPGATGTFQLFAGPQFDPNKFLQTAACQDTTTPTQATHGVLLDFALPGLTGLAQNDLAQFLLKDTLPPSVRK